MSSGSTQAAIGGERGTCNVIYEVATEPSVWRQFYALFVKNLKIMLRDYAPTVNSILSPVYFLVILIFLNLATIKPDKEFKINSLPYLTNDTCSPTTTPDCVHLAYTNGNSNADLTPIINQLRSFFDASEPNSVVIKSFASADDIIAQYNKNTRSVVVAVDFLGANVASLTSGGRSQYEILANHTSIYSNYIDTRFLTAQAYIDRALTNVGRAAKQLPLLNSPLPPRDTKLKNDATDSTGFPFITYAPFIGKYKAGMSVVNPYYMLFCFQPIWQIVLAWLARDNETSIKASLISMGLRPAIYQLSVWITQAALSIPMSAIMVGIVYAGQLFRFTAWYIVLGVFILFSFTAVGIGLLLAIPFKAESSKASTVSMIFTVLFLVSFGLTFAFLFNKSGGPSVAAETATFLIAPIAFGRAIERITTMEMTGHGVTPDNFVGSALDRVYYMLVIDTVLYLLLAIYLDRIFPGKNCHPLPWDYIFRPSFWRTSEHEASMRRKHTELARSPTALSEGLQEDNNDAKLADCVEPFDVMSIPSEDRGIITIRRLKKSFKIPGKGLFNRKPTIHHAVNGFTMQVHRNEIFGLLGHNGAGKTTTISMMTGGLQPDSGEVLVDGYALPSATMARSDVNLSALSIVQSMLGICPQHDVLFEHLTATETLQLFADIKGVVIKGRRSTSGASSTASGSASLQDYISHLLADVHLTEKANQQVWTYSGGMKRKLSVAIAFLGDPKVVLLDEPTTGMDVYTRKQIWQLIQDSKKGRAIVLTTHSMEEADALGDRIAIMSKGELQAQGTTLFLKNRYGIGYRLHVEKKRGVTWDGYILDDIVKRQFPGKCK
ncbi:hypothetical protein BDF19DRAFT_455033 [Syncephalis fuscata]|nr:hypothetical protein BDF19DRAFT_455033 [Syncephalis fuscata]